MFIPGPGLPARRPRKPRRKLAPAPGSISDRASGIDAMGGTPRLSRGHKLAFNEVKPSTGVNLGGRGYGKLGSSGPIDTARPRRVFEQ